MCSGLCYFCNVLQISWNELILDFCPKQFHGRTSLCTPVLQPGPEHTWQQVSLQETATHSTLQHKCETNAWLRKEKYSQEGVVQSVRKFSVLLHH